MTCTGPLPCLASGMRQFCAETFTSVSRARQQLTRLTLFGPGTPDYVFQTSDQTSITYHDLQSILSTDLHTPFRHVQVFCCVLTAGTGLS